VFPSPCTLFAELNSLSSALEDISAVVSSARVASLTNDSVHIAELRSNILLAHNRIVELRDTYVSNNMVNASAFQAVIAPAIADLQAWLTDGVSGYAPDSSITLSIIRDRISGLMQRPPGSNMSLKLERRLFSIRNAVAWKPFR